MNIFLLEECYECAGIIISEKTTREEIQEIVKKAKKESLYFKLDDLIEILPSDCKYYNRYSSKEIDIIQC